MILKKLETVLGTKVTNVEDIIAKYGNAEYLRNIFKLHQVYEEPKSSAFNLGLAAARKALSDIDVSKVKSCIFCSNTPTNLMPSNSSLLVGELNLPQDTIHFDINANCAGVLQALHITDLILQGTDGLGIVIGSDYFSEIKGDSNPSQIYSDAGCCIVVEGSKNILAYSQVSDSSYKDEMTLQRKSAAITYEGVPSIDSVLGLASKQVYELIHDSGIDPASVKAFCGTQCAESVLKAITDTADLNPESVVWVGSDIGYTGNSCIAFALQKFLQTNEVKIDSDNNIVLWALGAGLTSSCMIMPLGGVEIEVV